MCCCARCRACCAAVPAARLRVVGVGPELERLTTLHAELGLGQSVAFLGHIPFEQLAREYRDCAVFCLPSRQEGFGIVFLEAMAAGRPVVACRAAAIPEVVPDGAAGLLAPPGDPAALAEALIALLTDRDAGGAPGSARGRGRRGLRRAARGRALRAGDRAGHDGRGQYGPAPAPAPRPLTARRGSARDWPPASPGRAGR